MSSRPPRRCKATKVSQQATDDGDASGDVDDQVAISSSASEPEDSEEEYEPAKKRKKQNKKKKAPVMKDRGKLKSFASVLPLDLVGEICHYLTPCDLLNWSRSSRLFRTLLFKRSVASSWWKNARRNVGLPDLRFEMDEPAYASLIYDKFCMKCGIEMHDIPQCCANDRYARINKVANEIGTISSKLVKQCYVSFTWNPYTNDLNDTRPDFRWVLKARALEINHALTRCSSSNFASMLQGKGKLLNKEVEQRIQEAQEEIQRREEDGDKLYKWKLEIEEEIDRQKREEIIRQCKERRDAIEAKMVVLGFDEKDFDDDNWRADIDVTHPKKLTPAEWKKHQDKFIKLAEDVRAVRYEREAEEREDARIEEIESRRISLQLAATDSVSRIIFPGEEKFRMFEKVRPFWEEDEDLDEAEWLAALPEINAQIESYRESIVTGCFSAALNLMKNFEPAHEFFVDQILPEDKHKSATQNLIDILIAFDYLFHFGCQRHPRLPDSKFPDMGSHACNRQHIMIRHRRVEIVLELIKVCPPLVGNRSIRSNDLNRLGKTFECSLCPGRQLKRGWVEMVEHILYTHEESLPGGSIRFAGNGQV
ncbi:hypothetical protein JCM5350_005350 [Sporobolomyces pararoseus]